jgi:hypothetical protein
MGFALHPKKPRGETAAGASAFAFAFAFASAGDEQADKDKVKEDLAQLLEAVQEEGRLSKGVRAKILDAL